MCSIEGTSWYDDIISLNENQQILKKEEDE